MLVQKSTSKKKMILYIVIICLMVVGNIYYFNRNREQRDIVNNEMLGGGYAPGINSGDQEIARQKSILENQLFKELKKIGDWPIEPKKVGRANPFLPYFE